MSRSFRIAFVIGVALTLVALAGRPVAAQLLETPANPARVMVLGTWHFENPGLDVVQTEIADVLAPEHQAEIEAIAAALARFRPTVVLVEARPSTDAQLDSMYRAWRAGRHTMPRNEVQQLGFRLAASSDLDGVEPIDEPGEFPFGEMMEYAGAHDPDAAAEVMAVIDSIGRANQREHDELTMAEHLRDTNDPAELRRGHGLYVRFGRIGAGDGFSGANVLSSWIERNVRIFSHVQRYAQPGERVLVIFGSGHAQILRELVGYDFTMELVEPNDYLPAS